MDDEMSQSAKIPLRFTQHDRDSAGRTYVYPVLSRRAGGISLGINLNPNNACNWACAYCQVENLQRGGPPPLDVDLIEAELRSLLAEILAGDVFTAEAPPDQRGLVDIAFSGNGEPTSAPEFPEVVARVYRVLDDMIPRHDLPVRLITNGSLMHRASAQQGVALLGQRGGEVWFKVDRLLPESSRIVNGVKLVPARVARLLALTAELASVWVQTCWMGMDGVPPNEDDQQAYVDFLKPLASALQGVHLYGLARQSAQPEAARLSRLPEAELQHFAVRIQKETGLIVRVSA